MFLATVPRSGRGGGEGGHLRRLRNFGPNAMADLLNEVNQEFVSRDFALNIKETKDSFVFEAVLPGMTKEDVSLEVKNDILSIRASRSEISNEEDGESYLRQEFCRCDNLERQIMLPDAVDQNKVEASFKNGILVIEIPKTEAAKPKTIAINVK